jgi:hypothetical protein
MHETPDPAERHDIVDRVLHFDTAFGLPEAVLVIPEAERSDALLVDESKRRLDMLDLSYPGHGNTGDRRYAIGDDEAGMDIVRDARSDPKLEKVRRDALEIVGRGKERPGFPQADGKLLSAVQAVDFHRVRITLRATEPGRRCGSGVAAMVFGL